MKKNSKNNYQKNQRNRLRLITSNFSSIIDKSDLIDNYQLVSIFLTTLMKIGRKEERQVERERENAIPQVWT